MSVSAINGGNLQPLMKLVESAESGPDHDNDGDEGGVSAAPAPAVRAMPAPGTGIKLDKTA